MKKPNEFKIVEDAVQYIDSFSDEETGRTAAALKSGFPELKSEWERITRNYLDLNLRSKKMSYADWATNNALARSSTS